ncbi:MAG: hypothetical protein V1944_00485 [Candidatus Aenigmatarchaeota archaeon]
MKDFKVFVKGKKFVVKSKSGLLLKNRTFKSGSVAKFSSEEAAFKALQIMIANAKYPSMQDHKF